MKPTILTQSGLTFNLLEPHPDMIEIEDIAHALSHICRFTGHTRRFYSVAQHCIHASACVPQEYALEALLHDAAEAYIGDVSSPLKAQLADYRMIEFRLECVIRYRFGLPLRKSPCVKQADLIMLATEKRDLMPTHQEDWQMLNGIAPLKSPIITMSADAACRYFLSCFHRLTAGVAA